jgi:hypothetical protein
MTNILGLLADVCKSCSTVRRLYVENIEDSETD